MKRIAVGDASRRMLLYSGAILLIFGTLMLLYGYALRKRDTLGLDAIGLLELRAGWRAQLLSTLLAVASIVLALALPERLMWLAGVIYGLMGPLHAWNGYISGAALARFRAGDAA